METASSLLKLSDIIGNPKAKPPIPARIPVSKSTWYAGVKTGRFPQSVKIGNGRGAFWRLSDILSVLDGVQK